MERLVYEQVERIKSMRDTKKILSGTNEHASPSLPLESVPLIELRSRGRHDRSIRYRRYMYRHLLLMSNGSCRAGPAFHARCSTPSVPLGGVNFVSAATRLQFTMQSLFGDDRL